MMFLDLALLVLFAPVIAVCFLARLIHYFGQMGWILATQLLLGMGWR